VDPPAVLRGPTASQLIIRGVLYEIAAFLCTVCIAFERLFGRHEHLYGSTMLACVFACLGAGLVYNFRGYSKQKKEIRKGYTTGGPPSRKWPQLWYLHPKSLQVVAAPNQRRPPTTPTAKKWAELHPELPFATRLT
jgi:hypothetical protein